MIARLQNKVRRLCGGGGEPAPAEPAAEGLGTRGQNPWEEEVLAVLLQLGYRPAEARSLIRSVGARRPAPRDVEEALRTILAEGGRWS
ncbi:MAG: hypothetical protein IRY95_10955 [Clostridia bacterium]|nr:hypothetical protein [Clostridia bacterium]